MAVPHTPATNQNPNSFRQENPQSPQQGSRIDEAADTIQRKPDLLMEGFEDLDTVEYTEKYKRYEADYARRLKSKYFSKKNLYGGSIFENETVMENQVIKSSRWPCTRSFTDPVQSFEGQSNNSPNKKYQTKKSSC